jgi:hypothetical protein
MHIQALSGVAGLHHTRKDFLMHRRDLEELVRAFQNSILLMFWYAHHPTVLCNGDAAIQSVPAVLPGPVYLHAAKYHQHVLFCMVRSQSHMLQQHRQIAGC